MRALGCVSVCFGVLNGTTSLGEDSHLCAPNIQTSAMRHPLSLRVSGRLGWAWGFRGRYLGSLLIMPCMCNIPARDKAQYIVLVSSVQVFQ